MADSTKAPRGLLISGLVLLLLGLGGCIGGGVVAAGPVSEFVDSLSNLEDAPFGEAYEFAGTGTTAAVVTTGDALCAAKDSSGQAVQLDQPSADFSGGSADQEFDVDSTFSTTEGETYQVVCDGSGGGTFAVITLPENLSTVAAGAAVGGLGGLLRPCERIFHAQVCTSAPTRLESRSASEDRATTAGLAPASHVPRSGVCISASTPLRS